MALIHTASALVLLATIAGCSGGVSLLPEPQVTGTYSDMFIDEPSDEVVGTEIRIVRTATGLQGTVQIGGGPKTGLSELIVVDVYQEEDGGIWFIIPEGERWAGIFRGTVRRSGLVGTMELSNGSERFLVLERARSIWD